MVRSDCCSCEGDALLGLQAPQAAQQRHHSDDAALIQCVQHFLPVTQKACLGGCGIALGVGGLESLNIAQQAVIQPLHGAVGCIDKNQGVGHPVKQAVWGIYHVRPHRHVVDGTLQKEILLLRWRERLGRLSQRQHFPAGLIRDLLRYCQRFQKARDCGLALIFRYEVLSRLDNAQGGKGFLASLG